MYELLSKEQRDKIYNDLGLERFANDRINIYESDSVVSLSHGLTVRFTLDSDVLHIIFESMSGDSDAEAFSELTNECSKAVDDIGRFLESFLDEELFKHYFTNYPLSSSFESPPYRASIIVPAKSDTIQIPTEEFVVNIQGEENNVQVPKRRIEEGTVDQYIENVWWRRMSNRDKLECVGVDGWNLEDAEFEKA